MKIKSLIILAIFISLGVQTFAQNAAVNPYPKRINVTGSAEMEIVPDELFFTVTLREYLDKDKKKTSIEKLEKELQSAVSAAGVAKENLQFENVYGERWKEKKGKPEDFMQSKTYIIKLTEPSKIDVVLDKIDAKGIENVYLSNYSHSKIEQYRKELKIQAIKNTKEKAKYLLEAVGDQIGSTISITEIDNYDGPIIMNRASYLSNTSQTSMRMDGVYSGEIDSGISFKTIKLRFSINGEFEIK